MNKKKKQAESQPMTIGRAMYTCHANEKAALESIPHKVRYAFPDITLHGTLICFDKYGDFLTHDEAVEAVRLLLELLRGDK